MPIITVKNLGKKYHIKHTAGGYVALRDVIANVTRHPFQFLKNKAKQAIGATKQEEYWALKDVNFEVEKGEVIGIIGANGAGKSTLLKILSQITPPTEGEIVINGRVASLLEVGTGFHPELTGRENIFLNGAILGMPKAEIARKFDAIVEFAGIGQFLDTPVRFYSSGMYVRLAFSVAAHLEPDILIIDEVLAVGDAEFQKKCLGKMKEVATEEGRTVLFVSHNMEAVERLCEKVLVLKQGQVVFWGDADAGILYYQEHCGTMSVSVDNGGIIGVYGGELRGIVYGLIDAKEKLISRVLTDDPLDFYFEFDSIAGNLPLFFSVAIVNSSGVVCIWLKSNENSSQVFNFKKGKHRVILHLDKHLLVPGAYSVNFSIRNADSDELYLKKTNGTAFQVVGSAGEVFHGIIKVDARWRIDDY